MTITHNPIRNPIRRNLSLVACLGGAALVLTSVSACSNPELEKAQAACRAQATALTDFSADDVLATATQYGVDASSLTGLLDKLPTLDCSDTDTDALTRATTQAHDQLTAATDASTQLTASIETAKAEVDKARANLSSIMTQASTRLDHVLPEHVTDDAFRQNLRKSLDAAAATATSVDIAALTQAASDITARLAELENSVTAKTEAIKAAYAQAQAQAQAQARAQAKAKTQAKTQARAQARSASVQRKSAPAGNTRPAGYPTTSHGFKNVVGTTSDGGIVIGVSGMPDGYVPGPPCTEGKKRSSSLGPQICRGGLWDIDN